MCTVFNTKSTNAPILNTLLLKQLNDFHSVVHR